MNNQTPSSLKQLALTLLALASVAVVHAGDVSGVWTWITPGRNGGSDHTNTLTLKADGAALTGTVSSPGREGRVIATPITAGKLEGDSISFLVVRQVRGNSVTNNYSGAVVADKITGKISATRDGALQSHDWVAQRAPAAN